MKVAGYRRLGFTLVELMIVVVVISILATVTIVAYNGITKNAARSLVADTLTKAAEAIRAEKMSNGQVNGLPNTFRGSSDVELAFVASGGSHYDGLTAVQNGVLFYNTCKDLIADPQYSTIHAKDGGQTSSVVMSCDDNVNRGGILITGWDSRTWSTPVTAAQIDSYKAGVPYDGWWTDRQVVIRSFYSALVATFLSRGGTLPVTSFWDPWANQWSGVPKEDLPTPTSSSDGYCVEAHHRTYSDLTYKVTSGDPFPELGSCAS